MKKIENGQRNTMTPTKKTSVKNACNDTGKASWTRNCPSCQILLTYGWKKHRDTASKQNTLCRSCSHLRDRVPLKRICKVCGDIKLTYDKVAARRTYCEKCRYLNPDTSEKLSKCKTGNKHHFYGKHFTKEHAKKISIGNKGKSVSSESRKRISMARIGKSYCNTRSGATLSEETKRKIRIGGQQAYLRKRGGYPTPFHNPIASKLFDKLEKYFGWDGQYATKGGEYRIVELGYWVDYYEPTLNLVIEYDEKHHSRRKEKDVIRQQNIYDKMKCKFIRISEFDSWEDIIKKCI